MNRLKKLKEELNSATKEEEEKKETKKQDKPKKADKAEKKPKAAKQWSFFCLKLHSFYCIESSKGISFG